MFKLALNYVLTIRTDYLIDRSMLPVHAHNSHVIINHQTFYILSNRRYTCDSSYIRNRPTVDHWTNINSTINPAIIELIYEYDNAEPTWISK